MFCNTREIPSPNIRKIFFFFKSRFVGEFASKKELNQITVRGDDGRIFKLIKGTGISIKKELILLSPSSCSAFITYRSQLPVSTCLILQLMFNESTKLLTSYCAFSLELMEHFDMFIFSYLEF